MIIVYGWDTYYPAGFDGNVLGIVESEEMADKLIELSKESLYACDHYEKQELFEFIEHHKKRATSKLK